MTEDCFGQANIPAVQIVAQGSEADVHSLANDLFKFAQDNFHNTLIMHVTKESALNFWENSFPASNLSFHLQCVETNFFPGKVQMQESAKKCSNVKSYQVLYAVVLAVNRQKVKQVKAIE